MNRIKLDEKESLPTKLLYNNIIGRIILKVITRPFFSKIAGYFLDTKISTIFINSFIKSNNIDMSIYEQRKYISFNDFFTRRKINIDISDNKKDLISPCDAKLTVYKIDNTSYKIKNSYYTLRDLLDDDILAKKYMDGYIFIFRLTKDDYHRYHYIDNGKKSKNIKIKGLLHTVRPIAMNYYNVYKTNSREYSILNTENFKDVIQMEVGALMVGKINNYHEEYTYKKGEEKGMFLFGGSTIILLFEKDAVEVSKKIITNTNNSYETIVRCGQIIGKSK